MLFKHIETQSTAIEHAQYGTAGAIIASVVGLFAGEWYSLAGFVLGGLLAGIAIELVQYIQRYGGEQNSLREMVLDGLMAGLWPLVFWLKR